MTAKPAIRAEAERLFAGFQAAGAVSVEADLLLPAETLLDLYGEDIREMCIRDRSTARSSASRCMCQTRTVTG